MSREIAKILRRASGLTQPEASAMAKAIRRTTSRPCVSVPADLAALYREHRARLPSLSALLAQAMRGALADLDVPAPSAATSPPPRTAAATRARWRQRAAT